MKFPFDLTTSALKLLTVLLVLQFSVSSCRITPKIIFSEDNSRTPIEPDGSYSQDEMSKLISKAVSEMISDTSNVTGQKIAVGSFNDNRKSLSELSILMADMTEMVIKSSSEKGEYDVIGRDELKQNVDEWALGAEGLVSEENLTQAGRLLGVDIFCFGIYTLFDDTITLHIKMVATKTGEVLTELSKAMKADSHILEMSKNLLKTDNPANKSSSSTDDAAGEEINVELWTEKEIFKSGDKIKFFVKTDRDCYLSLIHIDAIGNATLIFPNFYNPSNFVIAGRTYTIPSEESEFDFIASEPYGYEIVRVIATNEPQIDVITDQNAQSVNGNEKIYATVNEINEDNPFGSFIGKSSELSRGISKKSKSAKKNEWASAVIKIRIAP